MSTLSVVPTNRKSIFDKCLVCDKPLGQESKDEGYITCHEHRQCSKCNLELRPREIQWCFDKLVEDQPEQVSSQQVEQMLKDKKLELTLIHPRCLSISHPTVDQDATLSLKQSEMDYLNLIRLMVEPNMDLSIQTNEQNAMIQSSKLLADMDWDAKYAHLKMLEACVAQVSIALAQDRKKLKERADEREKVKFERAKKEALTSSRPAGKPVNDEKEVLLGAFMERNRIKERKTAQKIMSDRSKAILGFVACGMSEKAAQDLVDAELVKKGILKA